MVITLETAAAIAALSVSLGTLSGGVYLAISKWATITFKVDTMWNLLLRRSLVTGVREGLLSRNSPITVEDHAIALMEPLADDLRKFYASVKKPISDTDLALLIEGLFGTRMLDEVCFPNDLDSAVCLPIAVAVAKGNPQVCLS